MRRFVIATALAVAMPTLAVAAPTPATIRVDTATREYVRQVAVRSARSYTDNAGVRHALTRDTALGQLVALGAREHLAVGIKSFSFGPEVYRIGSIGSLAAANWQFAVNGAVAPVAADHVRLRPGDRVVWWYITSFKTQCSVTPLDVMLVSHHASSLLFLVRRTIVNCATGAGVLKPAKGAVLTVNKHRYPVGPSGRVTVTLAKHAAFRARATQAGAIRSETLTGRL